MRYDYDADMDSLFFRFREGRYADSEEIYPGFVVDFDDEGRPLSIDLDDASTFIESEVLQAIAAALRDVERPPAAAKKR